jgi:hypothetical protein
VERRKIFAYLQMQRVLRCFRSCGKTENSVVWLCRVEFGAVALCLCAVIARVMVREGAAFARACAAEDWLLLAGSLATVGRMVMAPWMGDVGAGWVWMFAATCAAHLAVKGFRATRVEN